MLNLARALQGVGASLLLTASLAVINHAFAGPERAKAYAFWGACLGIAITAGPIGGGVLTALCSWRWAFLVNVPLGVALCVTAAIAIAESRDPEATRLDLVGILTFSAGLFLLILALIDGNSLGWGTAAIVWRLAGAGALLTAFVCVELRQQRPMVDVALFTQPTFLGAACAMLGYAGGAQVLIFFLPLLLQNAYGFAPARAGLPMLLTPRLGAGLATRYSGRTLLTLGLATTLLGDLLLSACALTGMPYAVFIIGMLVAGAGAGLLNSETATVMQSAVPAQRAGMASGLSATTRFTGLLLGVAALGAVLSDSVARRFVTASTALGVDPEMAAAAAKRVAAGDLTGATAGVPTALHAHLHAAASQAFAGGFAEASLVAAAVAAMTGVLAFTLVRPADTAPAGPGEPPDVVVAAME
jgi:predicted MFS family arabinose efflux permease